MFRGGGIGVAHRGLDLSSRGVNLGGGGLHGGGGGVSRLAEGRVGTCARLRRARLRGVDGG